MTWLTTWPIRGIPQCAVHPTESAAEAHAAELVRSGTTSHATAYRIVLPDEESDR